MNRRVATNRNIFLPSSAVAVAVAFAVAVAVLDKFFAEELVIPRRRRGTCFSTTAVRSRSAVAIVALALFPAIPAFAQQPQPAPTVTIWHNGVSPLGPKHKDDFGGYGLSITHHATSGIAETHEATADIMVIQSGEATLVYGGEIVDPKRTAPHELRGPSIRNGTSVHVSAGDVIHFPAGMPHQWLVDSGKQLTYLVIHIDREPATTAPIKS